MAADLGPGDWVEFYRPFRGEPIPEHALITLGGLYQIESLTETIDAAGLPIPAIHLSGYRPRGVGGVAMAYPLECFRPARLPSRVDFIERLRAALRPKAA